MTLFFGIVVLATAVFTGLAEFIRRRVSSVYRGALFIVLSGLYFTLFFVIAQLLRERFK
jgi:hypothetical protein